VEEEKILLLRQMADSEDIVRRGENEKMRKGEEATSGEVIRN